MTFHDRKNLMSIAGQLEVVQFDNMLIIEFWIHEGSLGVSQLIEFILPESFETHLLLNGHSHLAGV